MHGILFISKVKRSKKCEMFELEGLGMIAGAICLRLYICKQRRPKVADDYHLDSFVHCRCSPFSACASNQLKPVAWTTPPVELVETSRDAHKRAEIVVVNVRIYKL